MQRLENHHEHGSQKQGHDKLHHDLKEHRANQQNDRQKDDERDDLDWGGSAALYGATFLARRRDSVEPGRKGNEPRRHEGHDENKKKIKKILRCGRRLVVVSSFYRALPPWRTWRFSDFAISLSATLVLASLAFSGILKGWRALFLRLAPCLACPPPMEHCMISIIVPAFNESPSLEQLYRELDAVASSQGYDLQIILIDDGSTDGTWDVIERLSQRDKRVLGIRFRGNFGKAAALSAGFEAALGEVIVTMDADLQDDPAEIPKLLAKLEEGLDVVSGWKRQRYDPWHKVWPSRVFNKLVSWLTGVWLHDHNCGLKCFRREVVHEVRMYGELHRFVPVLAAARGFRVGEVVVQHRRREHGQSKYGLARIPKGLLDLLTVRFITVNGLNIGWGWEPCFRSG